MKWRLCAAVAALSLLLSGCAQTRETSSTIFAMNTVMELTAYGDSGQQVLDQATERIYQLEHLLSVTDENSDISAINHGEGAWIPVSQETFQLLSLALSYGRETQGALDITAYSAVHAWGFTTGEYRVPGPEELAELAARIDYTQVELDPEGCRVRLPQAGDQFPLLLPGQGAGQGVAPTDVHHLLRLVQPQPDQEPGRPLPHRHP